MIRLILILASLLVSLTAIGDNIIPPINNGEEAIHVHLVTNSGKNILTGTGNYLYREYIGKDYYKQSASLRDGAVLHVDTSGSDEAGDGSEASPYATIQNAINLSSDYDTVLVHPGTYYENIVFNGHNTIVSSLAPITGD